MESETVELALPQAPRGLCFDRLDFVKSNFSVDNFLVDHQNVASLESMRDDLGVYLKVLRLAMIELINKDYANFVNLSATLIGFDKSIKKIQEPLGQLNEEVLGVKKCLEEAMKELSMWLNQRHTLQKKKELLKYYSQTIRCLGTLDKIICSIADKTKEEKITLADRGAMQYNQLKFTVSKCENLLNSDQKTQYRHIEEKLTQTLNDLLFQFWNDNDEDNLLKALITLSNLDKVAETEILIRKQAIAPFLQEIINEPLLQKNADGLKGIYNKILSLLDTKLKLLFTIMQHSKLAFLVKKYRFFVNCFWCEVESRLEVNLASIFAPGNPRIFYKRYSESMQFIKKLEEYCQDKEIVMLLHETAEYRSFQKRWNLPVYFQIRFQEIAGTFEASLLTNPVPNGSDSDFLLKETHNCWMALQECWSDGIYIEALAHKFWKLSLQLLLRYASWIGSCCNQKSTSPKLETCSVSKEVINSSINLYLDLQKLHRKIPELLQTVTLKVPIENKDLILQSIKPTEEALKYTENKIKDRIVNELFDSFNGQLKQVSDIPRLYRKTNRSIPSKPCQYIEVITKLLRDFNQDVGERVDNAFLLGLFESLFTIMTNSYYKYVEDVLTSVQKTEESLRRLKQIRDKASPNTVESAGVSDGDKIRLQVNVDIIAYGKLAEMLQLNVNSVEKLKALQRMVTEAVRNIEIK